MPWLIWASMVLLVGAFGVAMLDGYVIARRMAAEAVEGEERLH